MAHDALSWISRRAPRACALCALAAWVSVTLTHTPAMAHELPTERQIIVQLGASHASVLITYQDPRRERADVVFGRYDLNRDGLLDPHEATLAAQMVLPMALQGVQIEVVGHSPQVQEPRVKIVRDKRGELVMMALVTYALPTLPQDQTRELRVSLSGERRYPALVVRFDGLDQVTLARVDSRQGHAAAKPVVLEPGQTTRATFQALAQPADPRSGQSAARSSGQDSGQAPSPDATTKQTTKRTPKTAKDRQAP